MLLSNLSRAKRQLLVMFATPMSGIQVKDVFSEFRKVIDFSLL